VKFIFGFLAFIAAVVVVVLLIVGFVKNTTTNATKSRVTSTATLTDDSMISSVVRYTIAGQVTADENYNETHITISQNTRSIEVLKGYEKKVVKTVTLANNKDAYKAFLGALTAAQYSAKRDTVTQNERTTCVTGSHYRFELSVGTSKKVDSWTTSCSSNDGSFAGNAGAVEQLFKGQFPSYSDVVTATEGTYNLAPL